MIDDDGRPPKLCRLREAGEAGDARRLAATGQGAKVGGVEGEGGAEV